MWYDVINNTPTDFDLFVLLRSNMTMGEVQIKNLSSKNRAILHKVCANYGLEHYSTGNYSDRVIVIKDTNHVFFDKSMPVDKNDYLFINKECNVNNDVSCTISSTEQNNLRRSRFVKRPINYNYIYNKTKSPFSFSFKIDKPKKTQLDEDEDEVSEKEEVREEEVSEEEVSEEEVSEEEESDEESDEESEEESDSEDECGENYKFYNMVNELKSELRFVRLLTTISVGLNIITMYHL